jgi:3-dehydroquinate dehydratase
MTKQADIQWKSLCDEYHSLQQNRNQMQKVITSKYEQNVVVSALDFERHNKAEDSVSEILERMHKFASDENNY